MKKKFYALLMAFVLGLATVDFALAKDMIEIVVPTPPGGAVDMTARSLSKALLNRGYENIVTYHPGAAGDIAANIVLEKQNNVILVASSANFVFSHVVASRSNTHAINMQLIGPWVSNPMIFIVPANSNITTAKDLIDKAKTSEVTCGISNSHGEIELRRINQLFGTKFVSVPYKGTGQLIPDVLGGHVPCAYDQIAPYVTLEGKVKFLATSKKIRNDLPALDTVLPKYQFETWYAAAIPNQSNLMRDASLVDIVRNWTQDRELTTPLVEKTFVVVKPEINLNARAIKETESYKK